VNQTVRIPTSIKYILLSLHSKERILKFQLRELFKLKFNIRIRPNNLLNYSDVHPFSLKSKLNLIESKLYSLIGFQSNSPLYLKLLTQQTVFISLTEGVWVVFVSLHCTIVYYSVTILIARYQRIVRIPLYIY
jgi:hypothetical protein